MRLEWSTYGILGWIFAGILCIGMFIFVLWCRKSKKYMENIRRDAVTGGLTEAEFYLLSDQMLSAQAELFSMVSMHIGNYPQIVCTYGAQYAKAVMKNVSAALTRQLSRDERMVRIGEDSFGFLLKNKSREEVCIRLNRIEAAINPLGGSLTERIPLDLFFGICLPEKGEYSAEKLMDQAVIARRTMPADTRYHFYDPVDYQKTAREKALADSIEQALHANEFVVYYQPKVRLYDYKVTGAEALVRWRHPRLGLLSPEMFLSAAERYRKLGAIDRFVVEQVCQTLARWKRQGRELCRISINLGAEKLADTGFADECGDLCRNYDIEPSWIEFEIKEELLLENQQRAAALINRLHALGFYCAVDNFGADQISLQLLSRLDMDVVKLDGGFFNGNQNSRRGRYIVEALLKLTTQLHIQTVAEAVDSPGQLQFLQQAACDMVQGFCF